MQSYQSRVLCTIMILSGTLANSTQVTGQSLSNQKIKVQKIWDEAPHSAFTDILYINNNFFCTFRE
ncbi:hypothetical protein ACFLU5_07260, partial [Bacteroidota bacterium]